MKPMGEYDDPIVTCPLNSSHRVKKSGMQKHVLKCLKNHDLKNKRICDYNPMHIINANEMEKHYEECESYASIEIQKRSLNARRNFSGIISPEEANDQINKAFAAFGITNDSVDRYHTIDGPGYDPIKANITKPLYRPLNCEPKSIRKQFRIAERQRHAASLAQGTYEWQDETERNDNYESLEDQPMSNGSALMTNNDYQDENNENNGNVEEDRSQFDVYSSDNGLTNENKSETSKDESTEKFENECHSSGRFENLSNENNHSSLVDEMGFTTVSKKKSSGAIKKKITKKQPEASNQNKSGPQQKGNKISKEAAKTPVNKSTNQANSSFSGNTNSGLARSCNVIGGRGIVHAEASNPGRSNSGLTRSFNGIGGRGIVHAEASNPGRSNPGPSKSQNTIGGRGIVHSSQRRRPGPKDD